VQIHSLKRLYIAYFDILVYLRTNLKKKLTSAAWLNYITTLTGCFILLSFTWFRK